MPRAEGTCRCPPSSYLRAPKLADFGLARLGGESEVSLSGYGMGTPYYMPPEQRRDAKSVNLWEVNEAFAAVTMAAMHEFDLPHDIVNVHGGACALGHPIGASGARIVVTLLGALKKRNLKRGVAALCIGGGEATALALEML
jgi:serine/threonine protein kinase